MILLATSLALSLSVSATESLVDYSHYKHSYNEHCYILVLINTYESPINPVLNEALEFP